MADLNDINEQLIEISKKLDDELEDKQSWKYYLSGATGGTLQGGLQLMGFNFDRRGQLNPQDPLPNITILPLGCEWLVFFLISALAGAFLGSLASILVIGNVTRRNLTRVCMLSAAFGLFFPAAFDFIRGYVNNQNSLHQKEQEVIESYQLLIKYTTKPEIITTAVKSLEQIAINNKQVSNQVLNDLENIQQEDLLLNNALVREQIDKSILKIKSK
jgi:hypothetical protein